MGSINEERSMPQFIKVATTDELADQQAKLVEVEGQKIALFRVDSGFYALSDTCTHRRGPLSEGTVEGAEVTCPWHGATFDIRTGAVLGPPVGRPSKATR
jgi:3-phenylpropionate/trans-cinnamate dioxygenase ferredoxin subunit